MKSFLKRVTALGCAAVYMSIAPGIVTADVSLPWVFGDHMVLQRDADVPVWGTAQSGEKVTVEMAGITASGTADRSGAWRVNLSPMSAGGPHVMTIKGRNTIRFEDVMVGEVWLCSGQSNMWWPLERLHDIPADKRIRSDDDLRVMSVWSPESRYYGEEPSWNSADPAGLVEFSASAYYFGRGLRDALGVPIGLIHSSMGGSLPEAWMRTETLTADPMFKPIVSYWDSLAAAYPAAADDFAKWLDDRKLFNLGKGPQPPDNIFTFLPKASRYYMRKAGVIYSEQLEPLIPFAFKGVIWYQGESSIDRSWQYRRLFPALIKEWRTLWGQGDFPFLFVQIANYGRNGTDPVNSVPEMREAQLMALSVPNTAMAVTIDIGEVDVHYNDKWDVGSRLALCALGKAYGKNVVWQGPMCRSMKREGNAVRVTFDHAEGLKTIGSSNPTGFTVAGADKTFYPAEARIENGSVVVSSRTVTEPVAVRYGWDNFPACNLYNGAGLPASPFRTDDWPGITTGRVCPVN